MKKLIVFIITAVICISTAFGAFASTDGDVVNILEPQGLMDIADEFYDFPSEAGVTDVMDIAAKNLKVAKAYRFFFSEDTYDAYTDAYKELRKSKSVEAANVYMEAWQNLTQDKKFADCAWYLWEDDNMPMLDGEELTEEDFKGAAVQDNIEYRPFVIKYLLDDPSAAKGDLLINAGGERANENEGYPVAEMFNSLGYNCFVVCRRCLPYTYEDKAMDLQRAIRMVKYQAQQEGWGGQDMIAAVGSSAGGIVILGITNVLYGYNTPNVFDTDYVPDEIDSINCDLDAVVTVYFGGTEIEEDEGVPDYAKPEFLYNEENPNWPATYLCSGDEDNYGAQGTAEKIYNQIKDTVPAELNIISGAGHGFGIGDEEIPETFNWPYEADEFMQENLGHSTANN